MKYQQERLIIAQAFIDLNRQLRLSLFPNKGSAYRSPGIAMMVWVGMVVMLGHARGCPFSVSKISYELDLTRQTVMRTLKELVRLGFVDRVGNVYVLSKSRAGDGRVAKGMAKIARDVVSKLDDLDFK